MSEKRKARVTFWKELNCFDNEHKQHKILLRFFTIIFHENFWFNRIKENSGTLNEPVIASCDTPTSCDKNLQLIFEIAQIK